MSKGSWRNPPDLVGVADLAAMVLVAVILVAQFVCVMRYGAGAWP